MTVLVLQTLAAAAFCELLRRSLVQIARSDATAGKVVGLGAVLRALAGVGGFWASYLELPILPSLQTGGGFWFFALDGRAYFKTASELASGGLSELTKLHDPEIVLAAPHTQLLAWFAWLFGDVPSVGLLLNLAMYAATCAVIWTWASSPGRSRRHGLIALTFYCFSPSLTLWSTQPLKETGFLCAIAVFHFAWARLYDEIRARSRPSPSTLATSAGLLAVSTLMIVGMRSYFAFMAWAVAIGAMTPLLDWKRRRTWIGAAIALGAVALFSQVFLSQGDSERLPGPVRALISPSAWVSGEDLIGPGWASIRSTRGRFEYYAGGTAIQNGILLDWIDHHFSEPTNRPGEPTGPDFPVTTPARLVGGFAACFIPRFIAMPAIIRMHGGQGFWLVAELDTIWFSLLAGWVAWSFLNRATRPGVGPMTWQLLALIVVLGVPLLYVSTNFGALLRYRGMLLLLIALIPLGSARADSAGISPPETPRSNGN